MMEHRSSTGVCHLTLNLAVTVALCHISLLIHCCVPPSVSGPPSLILLLWVPLKGCLSHMSIWSPQHVASPSPHSSSSTSHCPACLHNSFLQIVWSHQMYRILLRHLLKTPATSSSVPCSVSTFLHHTRVQSSHLT